ncbi:MAG: NADH-quinone oxidoreductase subunit NuoH [Anaerolineae bacterium]|nr:NADH-quinone oxidoreductase subunit NuoH [Anaerolineae bacterium]
MQQTPSGGFRVRPVLVIIGLVVLALVALLVLDVLRLLSGEGGLIYTVSDSVLKFLFYPNQRVDPANVVICRLDSACSTTHAILYSAILLLTVITGFAYTTLLERRFIAFFQNRVGPNRVGPLGLLQPAADAVKLITKEDITPAGAFYWVWFLAPMIKAVPVLIVLAVIPLGPDLMIPWFDGKWYQVPLSLADPNVGILWILGITSLGTYGIVLAGWSSNNKYAMLGGLRSSAQMISYELSLGITMAVPVIIVGSMSLGDITQAQPMIWNWFIFQNPLAAAILFVALLAEISRAPFDLPEAEQELTAGFMTEYSGMKFALFMMAEYLGMIAISLIFAALFLGGYQDGFGLVNSIPMLGPLVMIGKVILFLIFMIWIRATLPRIRYDRLMSFGWKVLLPLALVAVCWTAISVVVGDTFKSTAAYGVAAGILFALVVAGSVIYLRRAGKPEGEDELDSLADDPIVTGERRGIGWAVLNVVGALLAIPFGLLEFTTQQLENIAKIAEDKAPEKALAVAPPAPKAALPVAKPQMVEAAAPVLAAEAVAPAPKPATSAPAAPAKAGGKGKFDKEAMLAKIREKKANKGG